jgi:hypothetical protein
MADDEMYGDGYEPKPKRKRSSPESKTETALIPKSLCPGMEPGDVIKVRIVEGLDEEYLVEYVSADDEDEEVEEVEEEVEVTETEEVPAEDDYA